MVTSSLRCCVCCMMALCSCSYMAESGGWSRLRSVQLEDCQKSFLGNLHISYLLHALLTLLLFFEQLTLSAHISSIAFGQHVLAYLFHGLSCYNLGSYGSLNGYIKLLSGKEFLELFAHTTSEAFCIIYRRRVRSA